MNPVLEEIGRTGRVEDADGGRRPLDASPVTFAAGRLLYDHVVRRRPRRTLEIGLAYGISALFVCSAHADREETSGAEPPGASAPVHTAIDPYQRETYGDIGLLNLERAGLRERVRFFAEPSQAVLPRLDAAGERFDFAFVDGQHLFDYALVDLFYVDRLLEPGGVVAVDDLWLPAVRKAASFVLRNKPYRLFRPADAPRVPLATRALRLGRRVLQNPAGRDWPLKLVPDNVAFLEKTGEDERDWRFHRRF